MTVEEKVLDDLVEYMSRVESKLSKKEFLSDPQRVFMYAYMLLMQFNGTRFDNEVAFQKIIKDLDRIIDKKKDKQ